MAIVSEVTGAVDGIVSRTKSRKTQALLTGGTLTTLIVTGAANPPAGLEAESLFASVGLTAAAIAAIALEDAVKAWRS